MIIVFWLFRRLRATEWDTQSHQIRVAEPYGIESHSDVQSHILKWIYSNCTDELKGASNMDYKAMRDRVEDMVNDNHRDFVKVIFSIEKGIKDESVLEKLYDAYMDNDSLDLLNEEFDYMIEKLRE